MESFNKDQEHNSIQEMVRKGGNSKTHLSDHGENFMKSRGSLEDIIMHLRIFRVFSHIKMYCIFLYPPFILIIRSCKKIINCFLVLSSV